MELCLQHVARVTNLTDLGWDQMRTVIEDTHGMFSLFTPEKPLCFLMSLSNPSVIEKIFVS